MPKLLSISTQKIFVAIILGLLVLNSGSGVAHLLAQGTPDPVQQTQVTSTVAPVTITNIDPVTLTFGQVTSLAIVGTNFTTSTTVDIVGYGPVVPIFVNATLLHVTLPASLPVGQYAVKVSDPAGGSAVSPGPFSVLAAATLVPTVAPISVSHFEPTQVISGQTASLSVFGANFTANSTVHLIGVGFLTTTFINSGALTASLP